MFDCVRYYLPRIAVDFRIYDRDTRLLMRTSQIEPTAGKNVANWFSFCFARRRSRKFIFASIRHVFQASPIAWLWEKEGKMNQSMENLESVSDCYTIDHAIHDSRTALQIFVISRVRNAEQTCLVRLEYFKNHVALLFSK